ncbi:MAG: alpha-amylase [Sphingopyxis sp.]|nr:alpha-amylase [Sphingopyxis sp.]
MKRMVAALTLAAASLAAPAGAATAPTAEQMKAVRDRLPEDEVIYFVLPDRFENGDPANDRGGMKGDRLVHGFDPAHKGFYHGGDLKGLLSRLDYVQNLGVTAVWFAPIFRNKPVQGGPGQQSAGYHGYWVTDFTTIDPHFGTETEFKAFVDAAHARGMKVYMDIITNHSADVIQFAECPNSACPYRSLADYPGQAYTPIVPKGEERVKAPAWMNDPQYYHNRGNTTFKLEDELLGDFVGLDDFATSDPRVIDGFIAVYKDWIDRFGIDGFRIDTAKHVHPIFWQKFIPAITAHAAARGIPNFHIFGEVYADGVDVPIQTWHTIVARLPTVIDFAFRRTAIDTVSGKAGTEALATLFRSDALYAGGEARARQLPTFIGNHDQGRFAREMRLAHPGADDAEILRRVLLGHAMLLTLRGVPTIYSGDEQGFAGDGNDQDAREDMFPSQVAVYNDNDLVGTDATTADSNFDSDHPIYREIAAFARLRAGSSALRRGEQIVRAFSAKPGLFAVSRIDRATGEEIFAAFNTSNAPLTANAEIGGSATALTPLMGPCPAAPRVPGSIAVSLPPLGYMLCRVR